MARTPQANRPCQLSTPLGPDTLLPISLSGSEALSELYRFEIEALAENARPVPFDKLIGQEASVQLTIGGSTRHFHGIVTELSEGQADEQFTHYRLTLAPALWKLTRRAGFRIFQDQSVLDILKSLFAGLKLRVETVTNYQPRNFTVQYAETDFAFASRLMEQEGIYYYFEHEADGHTMVLADQSLVPREIAAPSQVRFDAAASTQTIQEARITGWRKTQQLCSGRFTYWDYNFHLPDNHLEATRTIQEDVPAGSVTHRLTAGANQELEVFQFTGGYGAYYDSLNAAGMPQEERLQLLFKENERFARLKMEQEACQSLSVQGQGTCHRFVPGLHFTLTGRGPSDGGYLLTRVAHRFSQSGFRSGEEGAAEYVNEFAAVPKDLPYRPARRTPWPQAHGVQPAVVVGPKGQELFTDAFGRVKVQFLWDREGKHDPDSSCWIRVTQAHAGNGFGFLSIPRVGEEVLIAFAGDNPDRPYVVGSVYGPRQPPPFALPEHASRTVLKSHSLRGDPQQFSGLAIEDQTGQEHVHLHSERDMIVSAENNHIVNTYGEHHINAGRGHLKTVGTPPRTGSCAGAGESAGHQSANSVNYTGPFQWSNSHMICELGYDIDMVYGYNGDRTCGLLDEHVMGAHIEIMVNPLGFVGNVSMGALGGTVSSLMGHVEFVLASHTELVYGSILEGHRGANAEMKGDASPLTRVLTVATACIEVLDYFIFGALDPNDRAVYWSAAGVTTAVNAGLEIAIVLSELIHLGEKTVEVVTEEMENEETAKKETLLNEQLFELYMGVVKANDKAASAGTAAEENAATSRAMFSHMEVTDKAHVIRASNTAVIGTSSAQISGGKGELLGVMLINEESLRIAFGNLGPHINLDPLGLTLAYGLPGEGPYIHVNADGIRLSDGETHIQLSKATGIILRTGDTMINLSPEAGIEQSFGLAGLSLTEAGVIARASENMFNIAAEGITAEALMMQFFVDADYFLSAAVSTVLV